MRLTLAAFVVASAVVQRRWRFNGVAFSPMGVWDGSPWLCKRLKTLFEFTHL